MMFVFIAEARETNGGWKKTPMKKFPGNSKVSELHQSTLGSGYHGYKGED